MWCNPTAPHKRIKKPYKNVPIGPACEIYPPVDTNNCWNGGHTKKKIAPTKIDANDVTIGTKRLPPKNPST